MRKDAEALSYINERKGGTITARELVKAISPKGNGVQGVTLNYAQTVLRKAFNASPDAKKKEFDKELAYKFPSPLTEEHLMAIRTLKEKPAPEPPAPQPEEQKPEPFTSSAKPTQLTLIETGMKANQIKIQSDGTPHGTTFTTAAGDKLRNVMAFNINGNPSRIITELELGGGNLNVTAECVNIEDLAKQLHEAGRAAVEQGATVAAGNFGEKARTFLEWDQITEEAREGRRMQATYLLTRYEINPII